MGKCVANAASTTDWPHHYKLISMMLLSEANQ